jgi:hypothetical protein
MSGKTIGIVAVASGAAFFVVSALPDVIGIGVNSHFGFY